jgi:acetyltransferase-like isoleucine patch superfamily enzyme
VKRAVKLAAELVASLAVAPLWVIYAAFVLVVGKERTFPGFSQLVALWPGTTGVTLRRAFYRYVLAECGPDSHIGFGTTISHAGARIGPRVYVGSYCMLGEVTLEADVLVSSHVSIINGNRQHGTERLDVPVREQRGEYPHVVVGGDSWVGERAVVMFGIGRQCIVGAGSIVTREVPDRAMVAGNPARIIGWREDAPVAKGRVREAAPELVEVG